MTAAPHWSDTAPVAHHDTMVLDYLGALWAETQDLAPELRDELMSTVADYIARRRVSSDDDPEAILRRLGPPEAIAAAVRRGRMPPHLRLPAVRGPVRPAEAPAGAVEYAGIALLTGGAVVLPVVAPLAGLLLVSGSPRWSPVQKAAAWMLAWLPVMLALVVGFASLVFGTGPDLLVLSFLAMVAGPVVAGVTLLPGLSRSPAPR